MREQPEEASSVCKSQMLDSWHAETEQMSSSSKNEKRGRLIWQSLGKTSMKGVFQEPRYI